MRKIILSVCVILGLNVANAQEATSSEPKKGFFGEGMGVGLVLTTNGVGLQFASYLGHSRHFIARLEGTYASYNMPEIPFKIEGYSVLINSSVTLGSAGLMMDYHPFKNGSLKLTLGGQYLLSKATANVKFKDPMKFNEVMIQPDEIGQIGVDISTNNFMPYFGIGLGRAVPKHRFGVNFEVGAFYFVPKTELTATNMLVPNEANSAVLDKNIKANYILPRISLNFVFRLTK